MAEVLTVSIDDTIKIADNNYTYYYNNKIYIVTIDYIYIFNPSLNVIEKRIQRTLTSSSYKNIAMGTGVGDRLYCYVKASSYLYKYYYDITNDTYNTSSSRIPFDSSSFMAYMSSTNDKDKNILYYCGRSSQVGYPYMWNYETNAETTVISQNISTCYNQIVYYDGKYYILGSGGTNKYYGADVTSNLLIYDGNTRVIINNILPVKLRGCSSFVRNGEIYFFGGEYTDGSGTPANVTWSFNSKIYVYNINNQSYRVLNDNISISNFYNYACLYNNVYYTFTSNGIIKLSFITYNNTYTFTNEDGSKVYSEITGLSPIISGLFGYNNIDNIVSYKFNTLSGEVIGSFEVDSLANKMLTGFSLSPKSRPIFYLNIETDYRVNNSSTFYASSSPYKPPATLFNINLYKSSAETNRVDKTNYLTPVGVLSGALRDYTSITDLSIRFQMETVPQFNYIYIESFNRYYFVTDISSVKENLWEISASCDVLMTYKEALYQCAAFIDRNEIDYNRMIVDNKTPLQQGQNITTHFISNNLFSGAGTYVIQGLNLNAKEDK